MITAISFTHRIKTQTWKSQAKLEPVPTAMTCTEKTEVRSGR